MKSSFELFLALKSAGYLKNERELLWWPQSGTFEVVVGAILTQQAKWEKVEKSLENLRKEGKLKLEALANIDSNELAILIKPSGFYNTKAKNLKNLCRNIQGTFGDFENFSLHVSRDWLLVQKGVGQETCDSILCYACQQEIFVVDSYTNRLLNAFGYEFESYEELQAWMMQGINENIQEALNLYEKPLTLNALYARYHGKIVEFCKENMRGKSVDLEGLGLEI